MSATMTELLDGIPPVDKEVHFWPRNCGTNPLTEADLMALARVCRTISIHAEFDGADEVARVKRVAQATGARVGVLMTGSGVRLSLADLQARALGQILKLQPLFDADLYPLFFVDNEVAMQDGSTDMNGWNAHSVLTAAIRHATGGRSMSCLYGYGCRENGGPTPLCGRGRVLADFMSCSCYSLPDLAGAVTAIEATASKRDIDRPGSSEATIIPFIALGASRYGGVPFGPSDWSVDVTAALGRYLAMCARVWCSVVYPGPNDPRFAAGFNKHFPYFLRAMKIPR